MRVPSTSGGRVSRQCARPVAVVRCSKDKHTEEDEGLPLGALSERDDGRHDLTRDEVVVKEQERREGFKRVDKRVGGRCGLLSELSRSDLPMNGDVFGAPLD